METLLTDKYDLMDRTLKQIDGVLFDKALSDKEAVAKIIAIVMEKDMLADQMENRWGR